MTWNRKMQCFFEILPGTREQRQILAQVMRWAVGAGRTRQFSESEHQRQRSTTDETRGRLDRQEESEVSENEDGAKVTPNLEAGGSYSQDTVSPETEIQEEYETESGHEAEQQPAAQQ